MKKCEKCFSSPATRMVNGRHLCDSCAFQEENAQCYRCQMYLPKAELVMWRGQLYCQYCLMDLRDEEARQSQAAKHSSYKPQEYKAPSYSKKSYAKDYIKNEYCERCGNTLYTVYVVNGRKLCKRCAEEVGKEYKASGLRFSPIRYKVRNKPIIISIAELLLGALVFVYNKAIGSKKEKAQGKKTKK